MVRGSLNEKALELLKLDIHSSHTLPNESRTMSLGNSSLGIRNQFLELTESASQPVVPGIPGMELKSWEKTSIRAPEQQFEESPSTEKQKSTIDKLQTASGGDIPTDNDDALPFRKLVEIPQLEWLRLTQLQSPDSLSRIREEPQSSTGGSTTLEVPHKVQVDVEQSLPKENPPPVADPGVSRGEDKQPTVTTPLNTTGRSDDLRSSLQVNGHPEFDMTVEATACHGTDTAPHNIQLNQTQCGKESVQSWISAIGSDNAPLTRASAQRVIRLYSGIMHRVVIFCAEQKEVQGLTIKKLEAYKRAQECMVRDYDQAIAENGHLKSQLQTVGQSAKGKHSMGECSEVLWDELKSVMTGFQINTSTNQITHQWMWEENRKRYAALESEEHALITKFQTLFDILIEERKMLAYSKGAALELKLGPMDVVAVQRLFDDVFFYLQTLRDVEKIERSTLAAFVAKVNSIHAEIKLRDDCLPEALLQIMSPRSTWPNNLCTQRDDEVECTPRRLEGGDNSQSESEDQAMNWERIALRGGKGKDPEHMDKTHADIYVQMTAPELDFQDSELAEMRFKYLELGQRTYEMEKHYEASVAKILEECREMKWQNSVLCELVQGYEKGENPPAPWIVQLALQLDEKCESEIRGLETTLAVEKKLEQWRKEGDRVWLNWIRIEEEQEAPDPDGSQVVGDKVGTLGECSRCEQYRERCARILRSESLELANEISRGEANKNALQDASEQAVFLQSELEKYKKRSVRVEEKVRLLEGAMKQAKVELPLMPEHWEMEEGETPHIPQGVTPLRLENIELRNKLDKVQKELRALESDESIVAAHCQSNQNAEYWQHMAVIERIKRSHQRKIADLMKESKERHQEWGVWSWAQFKSLTDLNNGLRLQIIENQRTLKRWATLAPSYEEREPWINCNPEVYVPSLTLATLREAEAPVYLPLPVSSFFTPRYPPPNWGPPPMQVAPAGNPPLAVNTTQAHPHGMLPQVGNSPEHYSLADAGDSRYARNIPYFGEIPYEPSAPSSGITPYGYRVPEDHRAPDGVNSPDRNFSNPGNASQGPTGVGPGFPAGNSSFTGSPPYDGLLPHANATPIFPPPEGQIFTETQYLDLQMRLRLSIKEIGDLKLEILQLKHQNDSLKPSETSVDMGEQAADFGGKSYLSIRARDDLEREVSNLKNEKHSIKKLLLQERKDMKQRYQAHQNRLIAKCDDLNSGVFALKEENYGLKDALSKAEETIARGLERSQELLEELGRLKDVVSDPRPAEMMVSSS